MSFVDTNLLPFKSNSSKFTYVAKKITKIIPWDISYLYAKCHYFLLLMACYKNKVCTWIFISFSIILSIAKGNKIGRWFDKSLKTIALRN